MKRLFLFVIIPVVLLTSCEPINVSPDAGSILSDYRDRWIGEYACQYGCVHSYQEGMDTANFVYDITLKNITISKVRDSLLYIDKGYICYCHVDSMGNISGPRFINNYQIYDLSSAKEPGLSNGLSCQLSGSFSFYGDKLSYYWIEYGQAGYWFRRYKCTKSPRKKSR